MSDAVLKKLQMNNGVIMISFIPSLTHVDSASADINHVIDHVIHVGDLIGYDHIGLGSDFDGMFTAVKGIDDVTKYPQLVKKMLERGISGPNVQKILGLNIIRVLEKVEDISASYEEREYSVMGERVKQLWNDKFRGMVRQAYPHAE